MLESGTNGSVEGDVSDEKKSILYLIWESIEMRKLRFLLFVLFALLFSAICEGRNNNIYYKYNCNSYRLKKHSDSIKDSRNDKYQDYSIDVKPKSSICNEQYNEDIFNPKSYNNTKSITKEIVLKSIIRKKGIISRWYYADYDGDRKKEAFAVIGKKSISAIYFINENGKVTLMKKEHSKPGYMLEIGALCHFSVRNSEVQVVYKTEGKAFFYVDHRAGSTLWYNKTFLFSVKNGEPYELELSDELSGFYVINGRALTLRQYIVGNTIATTHHAYMMTELIYDKKRQEFYFGKDLGENSGLAD